MHRVVVGSCFLVLALLLGAEPAHGLATADASTDGRDTLTAEASYTAAQSGAGAVPGSVGHSTSAGSSPSFQRFTITRNNIPFHVVDTKNGCYFVTTPYAPGYYGQVCLHSFAGSRQHPFPFLPIHYSIQRTAQSTGGSGLAGPRPSRALAYQLALRAKESLTLPRPEVRMNPNVEWEQIVHLPSWLWVEGGIWHDHSTTASAGPVSATVTAQPQAVVWDMGNGDRVTCRGSGHPYDTGLSHDAQSSDCTYTYRRSSAGQPHDQYTVTATVVWGASWTAQGVAGGGDLGTLSTTSQVAIRVAELQALVT